MISLIFLAAMAHAQQSALDNLARTTKTAQIRTPSKAEQDLLQKEFQAAPEASVAEYKTRFEQDVLPRAPWYMVGSFNRSLEGAPADDHAELSVDRDRLWHVLKFDSKSFGSGEGQPTICLLVRAEKDCEACGEIQSELHGVLAERFGRRGFQVRSAPSIATPLTVHSAVRKERAFEELLSRVSAERLDDPGAGGCDGVVYAEVLGEKGSRVYGMMEIRMLSQQKVRIQSETAVAASDTRPTQVIAREIGAHQTAQLFSVAQADRPTFAGTTSVSSKTFGAEKYIEVLGIDSFVKLQAFKGAWAEAVPAQPIEERIISRASFTFAVSAEVQPAELAARAKAAPPFSQKGLKFEIVKSESDKVVIALR